MSIVGRNALARGVANKLGIAVDQAERVIQQAFDDIEGHVAVGNAVRINGFGKFEQRNHAARAGRNPSTGEPIEIPARKVMAFKASKSAA